MDVFEFAMNVEEEGEKIYREFARKSSDTGIRVIFNILADMEKEHYQIFSQLKAQEPVLHKSAGLNPQVEKVLKWIKSYANEIRIDTPQLEIYRQAMESEKKAAEFYLEKAKNEENSELKAALEKIAAEEYSHYETLEDIIAALSPDPIDIEDSNWSRMPT